MNTRIGNRRTRLMVLGLVMAACGAAMQAVEAQTEMSPAQASAYREAKRAATATFLDRNRPRQERLEAAKKLGYPDDDTFAALLATGLDRTQDDAIRAEALRRHHYDDKYVNAVLKILSDPEDGGEELDASLVEDISRRTTFKMPAELRQRIQSVLRTLLADKRARVRLQAYRALVGAHDQVAVNQLADALRRGSEMPVPVAEAVDLLDQDGAINHIGTLRPYLAHPDPRVQATVARALSADSQSRPRIVEMVRNADTPEEVRLSALRGLAREDSQFTRYAIPLLEDARTSSKVRDATMKAIIGQMNYKKVEPAEQVRFAEAVERLATAPQVTALEGEKLRESARQLHVHLRKSFPEVQKHYENR